MTEPIIPPTDDHALAPGMQEVSDLRREVDRVRDQFATLAAGVHENIRRLDANITAQAERDHTEAEKLRTMLDRQSHAIQNLTRALDEVNVRIEQLTQRVGEQRGTHDHG